MSKRIMAGDTLTVVPERIEDGEWPDGDMHLREWAWVDSEGDPWRWTDEGRYDGGWEWDPHEIRHYNPLSGPWTRGERVK